MKKINKIAVLVLAGFIILSATLTGLFLFVVFSIFDSEPEEDSFTHEVEYRMEFQVNGTVNDTELLVPYPEDEKFQAAVHGNTSNVSIVNELNASLSIAETERGEMLRLDVGDFQPEAREERFDREYEGVNATDRPDIARENRTGFDRYSSYDLVIRREYNRTLDTENGLENEPHLLSNSTECRPLHMTGCASTEAFISYNTSSDTYAELNIRLEGRNSWWNWGWSGNHYSQSFYNSLYDDRLIGSQNRWITLTGQEEQGNGNYRDS